MKHLQEVSKSDLQAVKIWLGHFLQMFHVWELLINLLKFLQWESMGVYDFSIVKDRRLFGINTNLRIDHKLIPHTEFGILAQNNNDNAQTLEKYGLQQT